MKKEKIIDQPFGAREIIFLTRLQEISDETGVGIGIVTQDLVRARQLEAELAAQNKMRAKAEKKKS